MIFTELLCLLIYCFQLTACSWLLMLWLRWLMMSNHPFFFFLQCLQGTSCFCPLKHVWLRSSAAKLYNFARTVVLWAFQTSGPTWVSTFNAWLNQPHDEHHSIQKAHPGAVCFTLENNWCPGREEHPPICLQWPLEHCYARSRLF